MKLSVNFLISSIVLSTANLAAARNEKKGVAFNGAQACSTLEPHTDSSWWYSWGLSTGFSGKWNFCDADAQVVHPADAARADGMEFVPMFWNSVPDPNSLDADTIANMQAASHVMGFNEPELPAQANLSPSDAAAMWADVVDIAGQYNLNIVGPCMTKDGFSWYDEWLSECNALYPGVGCHHDVVCIHMYQNPHPCDTSKPWECIGDETGNHAKNYLNRWYNDYGNKPIWVTEYGCYPVSAEDLKHFFFIFSYNRVTNALKFISSGPVKVVTPLNMQLSWTSLLQFLNHLSLLIKLKDTIGSQPTPAILRLLDLEL